MFENCSYSPRGSGAGRTALLLAVLFTAAALLFARGDGGDGLDGTEGRCAYIARFGLQADPASEEIKEVELPEVFDAVLESYNTLQLSAGCDLREAAGKRCLCCSYDLVGYPGWDGRVIATLYIYRSRVIGGDIHTADVRGFMLPLGTPP